MLSQLAIFLHVSSPLSKTFVMICDCGPISGETTGLDVENSSPAFYSLFYSPAFYNIFYSLLSQFTIFLHVSWSLLKSFVMICVCGLVSGEISELDVENSSPGFYGWLKLAYIFLWQRIVFLPCLIRTLDLSVYLNYRVYNTLYTLKYKCQTLPFFTDYSAWMYVWPAEWRKLI